MLDWLNRAVQPYVTPDILAGCHNKLDSDRESWTAHAPSRHLFRNLHRRLPSRVRFVSAMTVRDQSLAKSQSEAGAQTVRIFRPNGSLAHGRRRLQPSVRIDAAMTKLIQPSLPSASSAPDCQRDKRTAKTFLAIDLSSPLSMAWNNAAKGRWNAGRGFGFLRKSR